MTHTHTHRIRSLNVKSSHIQQHLELIVKFCNVTISSHLHLPYPVSIPEIFCLIISNLLIMYYLSTGKLRFIWVQGWVSLLCLGGMPQTDFFSTSIFLFTWPFYARIGQKVPHFPISVRNQPSHIPFLVQ